MFRQRHIADPSARNLFLSLFAFLNKGNVRRVAFGAILATVLFAVPTATRIYALAPSQGIQVTITAQTVLGTSLSGTMLSVDGASHASPFSLTLQGSHTFSARSIPMVNGVFYRFVGWIDETGAIVATTITFTYNVQTAKSFFAVYGRQTPPRLSPIWSTAYESGDHRDFSVGNDQPIICAGTNNPGQVVSTQAHSGKYSGYYYINDPSAPDGCRAYYDLDLMNSNHVPYYPNLRDLYTEIWVYVPSVTLTGWVTFVNIKFQNWEGITIDSGTDRKLYIWDEIFTDGRGYQTGKVVQWPFDKWFKIGVEVHYRPANDISTVILYQDDVMIAILRTHALDAQPLPLWNFHWGLYTGGQKTFVVYNDDIAVYDLTSIVTTG